MSNSITLDAGFAAFVPASFGGVVEAPVSVPEARIDRQAVEADVRAELEGVFEQKLQEEVERRIRQERQVFDQSLARSAAEFDRLIGELKKDIQHNVVDLALRLSEVIVRHELPDREMLRNLIVKTLEPISDLQGAMVRISSHDWKLFGEEIASGDHLGVGSTVKFAEDPNLKAGDVIVESRNGIFDARLDERLKLLKESLHERSGRKAPEDAPEL